MRPPDVAGSSEAPGVGAAAARAAASGPPPASGPGRRVLVTGGSGFAGRHLVAACADAGETVIAPARTGAEPIDLLDAGQVRRAVADARPAVVFHLAARAHAGRSWAAPGETLQENLAMTLNLLEAVRVEAPDAVVVVAGSGEVYGAPLVLPVAEDAPLRPANPYAVSKASADLLAGLYADAHGLRVLRARPFNHAGPGQPPIYAIASFARQVAGGLVAGDDPVRVVTGNPEARRDFTDVRDVVRAYRLLADQGEPGIYNVCSGRAASTAELVAGLGRVAGVRVEHVVDPRLVRPHDTLEVRGSAERLRAATGWKPAIALQTTFADTVAWWREEITAGRAGAEVHE